MTDEEARAIVARCPVKRVGKRVQWFDTNDRAKSVRLCMHLKHTSVPLGRYSSGAQKVSVCAMCGQGSQATRECSICKVALHNNFTKNSVGGLTCFDRWHTAQSLRAENPQA